MTVGDLMKALAVSVIHLERRGLHDVPSLNESFNVLVRAGDMWEGQPERPVQRVVDFARGKPAIIDPERLGPGGRWMSPANDIEWAVRARALAIQMQTASRECSIRTERGACTPYNAVAEHAREKAILVDGLVSNPDGPSVLAIYHPQIAYCVEANQSIVTPWWAPAFYESDVLRSLPQQIQPELWISGHVHGPLYITYGPTRVVRNPVEGGKFNPQLLIEI